MKKMLVFLCAMLLGFGILGATQAGAISMQPSGLPLCGGSWDYMWNVSQEIDKIEVFITSGNTDLGDPPLKSFTAAGWGATLVNQDYGVATGPATSGLSFYTAFTADVSVPFSMAALLWNGDDFEAYALDWNGDNWVEDSITMLDSWEGFDRSGQQFPVPEPATMMLLGSGLIGLAALGRKKLFK